MGEDVSENLPKELTPGEIKAVDALLERDAAGIVSLIAKFAARSQSDGQPIKRSVVSAFSEAASKMRNQDVLLELIRQGTHLELGREAISNLFCSKDIKVKKELCKSPAIAANSDVVRKLVNEVVEALEWQRNPTESKKPASSLWARHKNLDDLAQNSAIAVSPPSVAKIADALAWESFSGFLNNHEAMKAEPRAVLTLAQAILDEKDKEDWSFNVEVKHPPKAHDKAAKDARHAVTKSAALAHKPSAIKKLAQGLPAYYVMNVFNNKDAITACPQAAKIIVERATAKNSGYDFEDKILQSEGLFYNIEAAELFAQRARRGSLERLASWNKTYKHNNLVQALYDRNDREINALLGARIEHMEENGLPIAQKIREEVVDIQAHAERILGLE